MLSELSRISGTQANRNGGGGLLCLFPELLCLLVIYHVSSSVSEGDVSLGIYPDWPFLASTDQATSFFLGFCNILPSSALCHL